MHVRTHINLIEQINVIVTWRSNQEWTIKRYRTLDTRHRSTAS